uniref:Uncharacterized protein n=1 Tax=Acrobeloides nanus TaxID=290746 RepID=A0A914EEW3_9BILA
MRTLFIFLAVALASVAYAQFANGQGQPYQFRQNNQNNQVVLITNAATTISHNASHLKIKTSTLTLRQCQVPRSF